MSPPPPGSRFGSSLDISGDTLIVGALFARSDRHGPGAAYVFHRHRGVWTQQGKLTADDTGRYDRFATSVAIDGDTALVGASGHALRPSQPTGAVYIYVRTSETWKLQCTIGADDGHGDLFGDSVALDADTALVGSPGESSYAGAAYVFRRRGSCWVQQSRFVGATHDDFLGGSVALDGNTALVGASGATAGAGAVYVLERRGGGWVQQGKLLASDGAPDFGFGTSVALAGRTALVGASGIFTGTPRPGAAYVFVRGQRGFTQRAVLLAPGGALDDGFGGSVALAGHTAFVGAPDTTRPGGAPAGAVYVFKNDGSDD